MIDTAALRDALISWQAIDHRPATSLVYGAGDAMADAIGAVLTIFNAHEPAIELLVVTVDADAATEYGTTPGVHLVCPGCGLFDNVRAVEIEEEWRPAEVTMGDDGLPWLIIENDHAGEGPEHNRYECGGQYIESPGCGIAVDLPEDFDVDYV